MNTILALAVLLFPALQEVWYPDRPGERDFVADTIDLITDEDEQKIRELCDQLLTDKGMPIIVVTIQSMAEYGARGWRIERYAGNLFDEWEIGYEEQNFGILLLVSKDDRKARIELGADWGGGKHAQSVEVMEGLIIPQFKAGNFSGGILDGVTGLDAMAREKKLPTPPVPMTTYLLWAVFIGLAIFTIISLIRRGSSGWAWLLWAAVFAIVGYVLYSALTSRGSSGGGFGGGSFGGGFSGGGGATGSW